METAKKSKIFIAVFIILIIMSVGVLSYKTFYFKTPKSVSQQPIASSDKPAVKKNTAIPPVDYYKGFALYKNGEFGFEIKYPENWQVHIEPIENVRGEPTKGFFFKKPNSDLRFAILPRDGLSYGLYVSGTSTPAIIGGSAGVQTKYTLKDGRRLWLLHPQYGLYNWSQDLGRIDALTSADDPAGDTIIFEKMLNNFKFIK